MNITIEKGIPLPARRNGREFLSKWAFLRTMEVGDSVFLERHGKPKLGSRVATQLWIHKSRYGLKFAWRTVEGGIRIWRIA